MSRRRQTRASQHDEGADHDADMDTHEAADNPISSSSSSSASSLHLRGTTASHSTPMMIDPSVFLPPIGANQQHVANHPSAAAAASSSSSSSSAGVPLLPLFNNGGGSLLHLHPSAAGAQHPQHGDAGAENGLEVLGLAQEQARRKESTGTTSSKYWLTLLPAPPRHPFVHHYFPIKLSLLDSKRAIKTGWALHIDVELLYEDGQPVADQRSQLELQGYTDGAESAPAKPIILPTSGQLELKIRFNSCSSLHENKNFILKFSGTPLRESSGADARIPSYVSIVPATSTPMTVIRHRLVITEQPPTQWYKDEGGRDKCMSIGADLLDENNAPVLGREVPLKVILCYEGEEASEVKNQSILKMPADSLPKVDRNGKVNIKVRIEEVSKNHQKQAFCIKLVPDERVSLENYDISPDVTTSITVLSKRNKRRKKGEGDDDDSPPLGPTAVGGLSFHAAPFFSLGAAAAAANSATSLPSASLNKLSLNLSSGLAATSSLPSITPSGGAAKPPIHPSGSSANAAAAASSAASTSMKSHADQQSNVLMKTESVSHPVSTSATGAASSSSSLLPAANSSGMTRIHSSDGSSLILQDPSSLSADSSNTFSFFAERISHLSNWCNHVYHLFNQMEWHHVGFEVTEDGQLNLHRPLYRCASCFTMDHQILTNRGWQGIDYIQQCKQNIQIASVNSKQGNIEYVKPIRIIDYCYEGEVVEIGDQQKNNMSTSAAPSSDSALSLCVTSNHQLFVRLPSPTDTADLGSVPFQKLDAGDLVPLSRCPGQQIQFMANVPNGLKQHKSAAAVDAATHDEQTQPAQQSASSSLSSLLHLDPSSPLHSTFLHVLGSWLRTLSHCKSSCFCAHSDLHSTPATPLCFSSPQAGAEALQTKLHAFLGQDEVQQQQQQQQQCVSMDEASFCVTNPNWQLFFHQQQHHLCTFLHDDNDTPHRQQTASSSSYWLLELSREQALDVIHGLTASYAATPSPLSSASSSFFVFHSALRDFLSILFLHAGLSVHFTRDQEHDSAWRLHYQSSSSPSV